MSIAALAVMIAVGVKMFSKPKIIPRSNDFHRVDPESGFVRVRSGGKWGLVSASGSVILPLEYNAIEEMREGLSAVMKGGKWGYIDGAAKVAIPIRYDAALSFSGGTAGASVNGKWGVINSAGDWVIKPRYDMITAFDADNLAAATIFGTGERVIYDRRGNVIRRTGGQKRTGGRNARPAPPR